MRLWLLPVFLALSPVVAVLKPNLVPVHVVGIGLAAALPSLLAERRAWGQHAHSDRRAGAQEWLREPVLLIVAGLLAFAWISEIWSTNAGYGAVTAVRLTGMAAVGVFALVALSGLESQQRRNAAIALAWGGVVVVAAYAANAVSGGVILVTVRHYVLGDDLVLPEWLQLPTRASALLVVAIWPLTQAVARQIDWRLAIALVVALGLCALDLPMRAVILAFAVSALCWAVAYWGSRRIPLIAGIALAAIIVILPPILSLPVPRALIGDAVLTQAELSATHRLKIWEFTLSKIAERPLLGWGLAASRELGKTAEPSTGAGSEPEINVMPLHPHNNALQVWVELGVLGALIFGALCVAVGWKISRLGHDPGWRACAFATFASYMTIGGLSYGVSQTWWVATAWLAAIFLTVSHQRSTARSDA